MTLYATTTSERASKGQGGNKFIRVNFAIGSAKDSKEVMSIVLDDKGIFTIRDKNHNVFEEIHIENLLLVSKGKQKKGEICRHCGRVHKNDTAICVQ